MSIVRQSAELALDLEPAALTGTVLQRSSGTVWRFDLAAAAGVAVAPAEPMHTKFPWNQECPALERLCPLQPRQVVRSVETAAGVAITLNVDGVEFQIALELGGRDDEVVFTLTPSAGDGNLLVAAELPGMLAPAGGGPVQVLACYRNQGRLFTGRPGALEPEAPDLRTLRMPDGRHRLRFFGVMAGGQAVGRGKAGYVAIIEENADAQVVLRQAEDGRLTCSTAWLPRMGSLAYPRVIRYRFADRPTVTTQAKAFREYARSAGLFRSLADKMADRPRVGQLVGATGCFIGYEKSDHDYAAALHRLRELGHERFYCFPAYHLNIGFDGRFGGFELLDLRDSLCRLREQGALVGTWVYVAGVPGREDLRPLASRNPDGSHPLNWQIGQEVWWQTCPQQVRERLAAMGEQIGLADAHHFDTTASNNLLECHDPAHPLDRRADRAARIALLDEAAAHGCIVASEGVKDWAVPHMDIGSNKEIPVHCETPAFRSVPLIHLVYHDALFMLWWEVETYDCTHFRGGHVDLMSLTDLLYGDMPLIFPVGRQYRWVNGRTREAVEFEQSLDLPLVARAAERAVDVARHFARVATAEMTAFDWLDDKGVVQQTEFDNGISMVANFGDDPFRAGRGAVVGPRAAMELGL